MEAIEKLKHINFILKDEGYEEGSEVIKDISFCIKEFNKIEKLIDHLNEEKETLENLKLKYDSEGKSDHSLCVNMQLTKVNDILFYIEGVLDLYKPIQ